MVHFDIKEARKDLVKDYTSVKEFAAAIVRLCASPGAQSMRATYSANKVNRH